jgi:hypothetical protein
LSFLSLILTLTGGFIDDETPIASGLGTYQHKMWNALENGNGNEDWKAFFAESTNNLAVPDSMSLIPIIVFDLYQERKNFLSGVLDVGYVITQKVKKKRDSQQSIR